MYNGFFALPNFQTRPSDSLDGVGARDAKRHLNLKSTSGLRDQTSARDAERHLNAPLF